MRTCPKCSNATVTKGGSCGHCKEETMEALPSNPDDFAYESPEEYEMYVGYKVNEAFKIGFQMGRVKNKHMGST